ncbi:MAG: hypothetical protein JNK57_08670 [Planctomycetaceae bacterium]|nr:hypothetical protein [Planctomycetaceae bacterium]
MNPWEAVVAQGFPANLNPGNLNPEPEPGDTQLSSPEPKPGTHNFGADQGDTVVAGYWLPSPVDKVWLKQGQNCGDFSDWGDFAADFD